MTAFDPRDPHLLSPEELRARLEALGMPVDRTPVAGLPIPGETWGGKWRGWIVTVAGERVASDAATANGGPLEVLPWELRARPPFSPAFLESAWDAAAGWQDRILALELEPSAGKVGRVAEGRRLLARLQQRGQGASRTLAAADDHDRALRARELSADGHKARDIGRIIAEAEGRSDAAGQTLPYPPSTVRAWLGEKRRG